MTRAKNPRNRRAKNSQKSEKTSTATRGWFSFSHSMVHALLSVILLVSILCITGCSCDVYVEGPPIGWNASKTHMWAPQMIFRGSLANWNTTGPLFNLSALPKDVPFDDVAPGMVCYFRPDRFLLSFVRNAQKAGCAAYIRISSSPQEPGSNIYVADEITTEDITINTVQIYLPDWQLISAWMTDYEVEQGPMVVTVSSLGYNPWKTTYESFWLDLWQVFVSVPAVVCLVAASTKLTFFLMHKVEINTPTTCLTLQIISAILRIIYCGINPVGARQLWGYGTTEILATFCLPFGFAANALIILYWSELSMGNNMQVKTFLVRFKKPFIGVAIFLISIEIVLDIVRAVVLSQRLILYEVTVGVYVVFSLAIAIFYIIAGAKLIKSLQFGAGGNRKQAKDQILFKATLLILASAGAELIFVIGAILFITSVSYTATGILVIFLLVFTSINIASLTQIFAFSPPLPWKKDSASRPTRPTADITGKSSTSLKTVSVGSL